MGKTMIRLYEPPTQRLRKAYGDIPKMLKSKAREAFCKANGVTEGTFNQKRSGNCVVKEKEAKWMEEYDPYADGTTGN